MANPNRQNQPEIELSDQRVLNRSFDREFDVLAVENLIYNPATGTMDRQDPTGSSPYSTQIKIDSMDSNIKYIGKAPIASNTSSAVWQIVKLDTTGGELVKTYADGNASFDNVFDDREALTYN